MVVDVVKKEKGWLDSAYSAFGWLSQRTWLIPAVIPGVLLSVVLKEVFEVCTRGSGCGW